MWICLDAYHRRRLRLRKKRKNKPSQEGFFVIAAKYGANGVLFDLGICLGIQCRL